ncbi:hypothetical protein AAIR29_01745 [Psychrobacter sp. FBL11]|uniref:EamA family transporter n=1 Tax=Psychrobacter saeujeotis TaxID=3143436 RepID=A0ABU9X4M2_9GAMM|nr:hypothetical protein [uncultured Psychrobacter sp.]
MANTGSIMSARQSWIGTIQIITAAVCWGTLGIFSTYRTYEQLLSLSLRI